MISWLLNLLGGSMGLNFHMPITGAEGDGEAGSGSGGGSEGAGDGDGDKSGEGGESGAAGGGSAGESGGGSAGSGDSFETDLAGKTVEELIAINVKLRDDRSKKNKQIETLKPIAKELIEARKENEAFKREKMNDDEKLQADLKAKADRVEALEARERKLRLKVAAGSTGVKVKDSAFVEYKIGEHLKENPDATDDDLAGVAAALRKSSPIAFEGANGKPLLVDTAGGGGGSTQGRATLQSELDEVIKQLEKRHTLSVEKQAELGFKKARLQGEIGRLGQGA